MAPTRRQVTLTLSAIYLAALTVLAAFALHHSHVYSLPIPDIVCALALALPPLAGVALETVLSLDSHLARKGQVHASRIFQATVAAFLIYETVVATLAGVYEDPRCLQLLRSNVDERYGVAFSREGASRGESMRVRSAILIILAPSSTSTWLPSAIRLPQEDPSTAGRPRQAIGYRDADGDEDSWRVKGGGQAVTQTSESTTIGGLLPRMHEQCVFSFLLLAWLMLMCSQPAILKNRRMYIRCHFPGPKCSVDLTSRSLRDILCIDLWSSYGGQR
ncbi:hypothetical protein KC363_g16 [Hortaea werneckii]|nr:hypothetical protein KC363_g16 [Hortaea werneckii]